MLMPFFLRRQSAVAGLYCICALMLVCVFGCSRQPASTADVPRLMPAAYKISVAPFTQPLNPSHLITGQIPDQQGRIPADALENLDMELREVLIGSTKRQYIFIPASQLPKGWGQARSSGQPSALERWLEYGREHGAQFLLVPQVLDWHEREGSQAGVTSSAHVRVEFFLLNIKEEMASSRSIFEEKQVGLVDNLLTVADFVKRKGQWVTAQELAVDGMKKAVKDLGL